MICDTCLIETGEERQMAGPHTMLFYCGERSEKGDVVYTCDPGCGRHYEQHHGYFFLSDRQRIVAETQRSVPFCQCYENSVMYISEILEDRNIRYRCPRCGRESVAAMPSPLGGA